MTDDEYLEWQDFHGKLFWMTRPEDLTLFRLWRPSLDQFYVAELFEASRHVAETDAAQFRTHHLSLLRNRVFNRRAESMRKAALDEFPTGRSVCADCRGVGLVPVPHVKFIVDGEWQYVGNSKPEMVVACRCNAGCKQACHFDNLRNEGKPTGITLMEYGVLVPHWRQLMADWRAEQKAERETREFAASIDERWRIPFAAVKDKIVNRGPKA